MIIDCVQGHLRKVFTYDRWSRSVTDHCEPLTPQWAWSLCSILVKGLNIKYYTPTAISDGGWGRDRVPRSFSIVVSLMFPVSSVVALHISLGNWPS